jgi:antitoxin CptB
MIFTVGPASVEPSKEASQMTESSSQHNRSYWRSRRGLLELDLLLPPFVKARFNALTDAQRTALQRLLGCEDQDIWDWFQRRSTPDDPEFVELIELIRAFNDRAGTGL